jgi:predicted ATPase
MRRFITLVDALYESKSLLLVLADADPLKLLEIDEEQKKHSTHDEVSSSLLLSTHCLICIILS